LRQIKIKPPTSAFGHMRITFTGKAAGQKDDMVMAFMQGMYHGSLFWQRRKYADRYGFTPTLVNGCPRL
jgi:hypothetical protein